MPIVSILRPDIPAGAKDKFLENWPTLLSELKSQPGVAHALGGEVLAEDGQAVSEFKFVQFVAFKTAEDEDAFRNSDWTKAKKAQIEERGVPVPTVGRFEFPEGAAPVQPKPFIQLSAVTLPDAGKRSDAEKVRADLTAAIGKEARSGKLLRDDLVVDLALIGWDNFEDVAAAYTDPKAADAVAAFKGLGETKSVVVKLLGL
jgi:hypothetical protein